MKEIPLLTAADIECRVQSVSKNRKGEVGAVLLLYKNARVDMRILDEVFGPGNWQREHEVVNGNLFCKIGVFVERQFSDGSQYGEWVWKQDVGVPSNTEAEKGEASDAFKRAGTNWGIGRELYTAPFIYVTLTADEYEEDKNTGKVKASRKAKFTVSAIEYNERREIIGLEIKDRQGGVAFAMGGKYKAPKKVPAEEKKAAEPKHEPLENVTLCADCNKLIQPFGDFTAERIINQTKKKYGRPLCWDCAIKVSK